jgi:hypothetical protein
MQAFERYNIRRVEPWASASIEFSPGDVRVPDPEAAPGTVVRSPAWLLHGERVLRPALALLPKRRAKNPAVMAPAVRGLIQCGTVTPKRKVDPAALGQEPRVPGRMWSTPGSKAILP